MIKILYSNETIANRVAELGKQISDDYLDKNLVVIVLLRGAFMFAADLVRHISIDVCIDFMQVSSYSGTQSTGKIKLIKDIEQNIQDQHVLIIEDIVDTGITLNAVYALLKQRQPASLEVCSFLDKPCKRTISITVKYIGFSIPNHFVVGYGMDYNQCGRQKPFIEILDEI